MQCTEILQYEKYDCEYWTINRLFKCNNCHQAIENYYLTYFKYSLTKVNTNTHPCPQNRLFLLCQIEY